jgi:AmmeMemoRadiSam system protein A
MTTSWTKAQEKMACEIAAASIRFHWQGRELSDLNEKTGAGTGNGTESKVPDPVAVLQRQVDADAAFAVFRQKGAAFVTLEKHGRLRGCIGTLVAHRPLLQDIAANALSAAFRDPRFPPLVEAELPDLSMALSILSAPTGMPCDSETSLINALRPGEDGLIIEYGSHRATYLPSVWEQLSDPAHFVRELKRKAGLPADFWHPDIQISRYAVHYVYCEGH